MSALVKAPWTPEQVKHLNNWQLSGRVHPFCCPKGNPAGSGVLSEVLTAQEDGWICVTCGYTQDWAHEFMTKPLPPDSLGRFRLTPS